MVFAPDSTDKMTSKVPFFGLTLLTLVSFTSAAQPTKNKVKIVGQMRNVMWKGQLYGTISLDTIANREHLYGFGPVEYLAGEILIMDGKSYLSTVVSETEMKVEETYHLKAPFFAYANIARWTERTLPDSIQTLPQLEAYLDKVTRSAPRPFLFKLTGTVAKASIHIVNLPKDSKVSSPDEAHQGRKNYELTNEPSEIIGFFSTRHKAVFTHHDTFLHLHLISTDRQKMGHLDEVLFKKGTVRLYLPTE